MNCKACGYYYYETSDLQFLDDRSDIWESLEKGNGDTPFIELEGADFAVKEVAYPPSLVGRRVKLIICPKCFTVQAANLPLVQIN